MRPPSSAADRFASGAGSASTDISIGAIDLTADGEQMHLRYPEGLRSVIDAALTLRGNRRRWCSAAM